MIHKNIRSKMKKTHVLKDHPIISQHIPETEWYNPKDFKEMLARFKSIYLKPNTSQ